MHLKRLFHHLEEEGDICFVDFGVSGRVYDSLKIRHANSYFCEFARLLFGKRKIIHLHSFSLAMAVCFILIGWRHSYGITIHNQRAVKLKSRLKKNIYSLFLRGCRFIIMNDEYYATKFVKFFNVDKQRIYILPAFIAPLDAEKKGVPEDVAKFRALHQFLMSANAFRLNLENGVDVYGLDLLVKLLYKLRNQGVNAGLLFCLPIIGNDIYFSKILKLIETFNLEKHILIIQGNVDNAFEYWAISDIFLRPTMTDMEGISVKEALFVGTNVVASDVCVRPKECYIFKNRDVEDLYNVVMNIYHNNLYKKDVCYSSVNTAHEMLKIYKSLQ